MKIYINNINLNLLKEIANAFKENLVTTEHYIELYTDNGIYMIKNNKTYRLNPHDEDIQIINNYYNLFTLIVDPSYYEKTECFSVHGDNHTSFQIKKTMYKLNQSSNIILAIEFSQLNVNILIPRNIYFETKKKIDVNELFIKNEIISFLSILE